MAENEVSGMHPHHGGGDSTDWSPAHSTTGRPGPLIMLPVAQQTHSTKGVATIGAYSMCEGR